MSLEVAQWPVPAEVNRPGSDLGAGPAFEDERVAHGDMGVSAPFTTNMEVLAAPGEQRPQREGSNQPGQLTGAVWRSKAAALPAMSAIRSELPAMTGAKS